MTGPGVDASTPSEKLRADGVLLFITAVWGGTFVVVKDALGHADPFTFLALRFALGGVVAAALAGRTLLRPDVLKAGSILGVFLFAGYAFQTAGLVHTTESRSAFITGLAVVLVPVVSILVFRRYPKPPSVLGVAMALAGLYVLTGGLSRSAPASNEAEGLLLGDLLTLGCAVSFAFHIALTERFAPKLPVFALVAIQLWTVCILSLFALPLTGGPRVTWMGELLFAAAFTGVFASAMAIGLQTWAQARTTAVRAALIFSLEPVFAAALSYGLGREEPGPREYGGGALLIAAVLVAEVGNALWARRRVTAG